MKNKTFAILVVLLFAMAGVATVVLVKPGASDYVDYRSEVTVKDFKDRDVPVPTSLDGGIITVGRLGAPRWLAYFPEEFESLVMVSDGLNVDSQGSLDYSYAYGDILTNVKTHSRDNMNDSERMIALNPSLILVDDNIYADNKPLCDRISKSTPLAVVDRMLDITLNKFWTDEYEVVDAFKNQADLYGKLLKNEERGDEIISYFKKALEDVRKYCKETSEFVTYVAGPIWSGSNPLTTTFNPYLCLELIGGENALGGATDHKAKHLSMEHVNELSFNRMLIEPYTILPNKGGSNFLKSGDSQGVLKIVEKRNNDENPDNDVKMFTVLPSVSHGLNPLCALVSAYHLASIEYGTLTVEDVREKGNELFVKFYGEEKGSGVMKGLDDYFSDIKNQVNGEICTDLFSEVEVKVLDSGEYIFTKKD